MLIGCKDCGCNEKSLDWMLQAVKELMARPEAPTYNITQNIAPIYPLVESTTTQRAIRSYTFQQMQEDMGKLVSKYPNLRQKSIGLTPGGAPLYVLEYGNPNATNHLVVINGFHGNENSASITLAQLETLILNNEYYGVDMWKDILNKDTCVHVLPMANPDCWKLIQFGWDGVPLATEEQKTNIKTWLTDYIRNYAKDEAYGSNWNAETKRDLEDYIRSLGGNPEVDYSAYVYRDEDLHCVESNLNGIDLHYNWYTPEMKATVDIALEPTNHGHPDGYIYGAQGATPYVNENAAIKAWIDNMNTSDSCISFLNYHQKGPTNIWNYRLEGYVNNRNYDCFFGLCNLMSVPYSKAVGTQSVPIGFTAWATRYITKDTTLACTMEVGWKNVAIRGDNWDNTDTNYVISPVPDSQWGDIYRWNKEVFLYMIRWYTSNRDIANRHQYLTSYNLKNTFQFDEYSIPSMQLVNQIALNAGVLWQSLSSADCDLESTWDEFKAAVAGEHAVVIMQTAQNQSITNEWPDWFKSKSGTLIMIPSTVQNTEGNYIYSVFFMPNRWGVCYFMQFGGGQWEETGTSWEWTNLTPVIPNGHAWNIVGQGSSTVAALCAYIGAYHTLELDVNKGQLTLTDLPADVGSLYTLRIIGREWGNEVQIRDFNSGNIWVNHYSTTTSALGNWYKIAASEV